MWLKAFAWLATASLALAPAEPVLGEVTVQRAGDAGNLYAEVCAALQVAPDAVLLPASCFERNLVAGEVDLSRLTVSFSLRDAQDPARLYAHGVTAVDLHPDFVAINCDDPAHQAACARAKQFCSAQLRGRALLRCLARPEPFARSLLGGRGVNVALAYLGDALPSAPTALVRQHGEAKLRGSSVQLLRSDGSVTSQPVLADTAFALRTAFAPDQAELPARLAFWTTAAGRPAALGLPSHLAELRLEADPPLVYQYTRLDTPQVSDWLQAQMAAGAGNGKRHDSTELTFVDFPEPPTDGPDPQPTPEPHPRPVPTPPSSPAPQPTPDPGPGSDPEPQPDPMPEPDPEPRPVPEPRPNPLPHPNPEPAPNPEPTPQPAHPPVTPSPEASPPVPAEPPPYRPADGEQRAGLPDDRPRGGCGGSGLQDLAALALPPALLRRRRRRASLRSP